jgi:hypothetical protein
VSTSAPVSAAPARTPPSPEGGPRTAAAALAPEPARLAGDMNSPPPGRLVAAASQTQAPRTSGTGASRYQSHPAPLLAAGGALAVAVADVITADAAVGAVAAEWGADRAVTAIYSTHYRSLVRLAAFLVRDVGTAEEVVQD